jgi:hypothetical protein
METTMGSASNRLHAKLRKMAPPNMPVTPGRGAGDVPGVEALIRQGFDPVHAAYVFVQNITSLFAEWVSPLPEMKAFARIAGAAEDEYMPDGPPISPLTRSFFTAWAFYDLRFGGTDTLGLCLVEANDVVGLNSDQLDALKKLSGSRMGVYEYAGADGSHVRLRELVTNAEFTCHCPSGYRGRNGELWYVRLLPPLLPDLADYHIVFTTPYILIGAGKDDWTQFFGRSLPQPGSGKSFGLNSFMKYGPDPNYWNEFVFRAYHHHQSEAIFLAGVPDLKATLPHA